MEDTGKINILKKYKVKFYKNLLLYFNI